MRKTTVSLLSIFIFTLLLTAASPQDYFDFDWFRAEQYFKKGVVQYNSLKFELAIDYFLQALELQPRYHLARRWLGKAYYQAGYINNALNEWETIVEIGGGDNVLVQRINTEYYRLGRPETLPPQETWRHFITYNGVDLRASFFNPTCIFPLLDNQLWIVGFGSGNLLRLNANGERLQVIRSGKRPLRRPFCMDTDSLGNIWVSEFQTDRIQKITPDGKGILLTGETGSAAGQFRGPEGLAVDSADCVYVVDSGNNRIQKFSPDGEFIMTFGRHGHGRGQLYKPSDIAFSPDGFIFISDNGNKRIEIFDQNGNWRRSIGKGWLHSPRGLRFEGDTLLIADGDNGLVLYDMATARQQNIRFWQDMEAFEYVSDAAFGKDNLLYIADMDHSTVEVFAPQPLIHHNIDVTVEFIDSRRFPMLAHYITVRTREGECIEGLSAENFSIWENDLPVETLLLSSDNRIPDTIRAVLCIDESTAMRNVHQDVLNAVAYFTEDMKNDDRAQVYKANAQVWQAMDWSWGPNRIHNIIYEHNYQSGFNLSGLLFQSISSLLLSPTRTGVVLFTSGEFDERRAFEDYTKDVIIHFAQNNHVPLYIIALGDGNEALLRELADETGGAYYNYYQSNELKDLRNVIAGQPVWHYLVTYRAAAGRGSRNRWRAAEVRVDFNGMTGKDFSGYYTF